MQDFAIRNQKFLTLSVLFPFPWLGRIVLIVTFVTTLYGTSPFLKLDIPRSRSA
jgi:hypothetical protein